jgi:hypothetical protein
MNIHRPARKIALLNLEPLEERSLLAVVAQALG